MKYCILWSGKKNLGFKKIRSRRQKAFVIWIRRTMENITWTDKVRNEEVFERVREKRKYWIL